MINAEGLLRLATLQQRVFRCIEDELEKDGHHKRYEGRFEIGYELPCFFQQHEKPTWSISFYCYLLLPNRNEVFSDDTLSGAISKAEQIIGSICEPYETERFSKFFDEDTQ